MGYGMYCPRTVFGDIVLSGTIPGPGSISANIRNNIVTIFNYSWLPFDPSKNEDNPSKNEDNPSKKEDNPSKKEDNPSKKEDNSSAANLYKEQDNIIKIRENFQNYKDIPLDNNKISNSRVMKNSKTQGKRT